MKFYIAKIYSRGTGFKDTFEFLGESARDKFVETATGIGYEVQIREKEIAPQFEIQEVDDDDR